MRLKAQSRAIRSAPRAAKADYLRHAVDELSKLNPQPGEETELAERRTGMMQAEKIAADLRDAQEACPAIIRRSVAGAAVRRLERRAGSSPALVEPVGEGDRRRHRRAGRGRDDLAAALMRDAEFDPRNSSASRSGCSRCAAPPANIRRSTGSRRWPRNMVPISRRSMPARPAQAGWKRRPRPTSV
jgi:hypothetical protein